MSTIQFFGAAGTVTGSSFLLTNDTGESILIDMGMFQGLPNISELNYQPLQLQMDKVRAVLLTHAHLDHCGRLPLLLRMGFKGRIFMTEPTRILTELTLLDSAKVAREHSEVHPAMFTEDDVRALIRQMEIIEYDKPFTVGNFDITYRDAGHIMGSASIEVFNKKAKKGQKHIVFSGDLGNSPEDLVRPTTPIKEADIVVMESTYGDRIHAQEEPEQVLQEEINEIEKSGGVLLIPAFAVERAQEILHIIDHLKREKLVKETTPVFLDSPMAAKATEVYSHFPKLYGKELAKHASVDDPFNFPGLQITEDSKDSKKISLVPSPKVIIAGSGMMNGGRILHHGAEYLPNENSRLLIVGFQAEGTIGKRILEGARQVKMYDVDVTIRGSVRKSSGMSAHADQPKLLKWLKDIDGVKKVFLIHGEDEARSILASKIREELKLTDITLPHLHQEVVI